VGVLFAGNMCFTFFVFLADGGNIGAPRASETIALWLTIIIYTGLFAGPGAFLLGLILAPRFHDFSRRFERRWRFLVAGMVLGIPLGFVNLFAVLLVLGGSMFPDSDLYLLFGMAPAGGAGLGLGCALTVPFRRPETGKSEPGD
jgi:hypothetical protein